jgi:ATP-binding cassette, subfamily B, bacterial
MIRTLHFGWTTHRRLVFAVMLANVLLGTVPGALASTSKILFDRAGRLALGTTTSRSVMVAIALLGAVTVLGEGLSAGAAFMEGRHARLVTLRALQRVLSRLDTLSDLRDLENATSQDRFALALEGGQRGVALAISSCAHLARSFITIVVVGKVAAHLGGLTALVLFVSAISSGVSTLYTARASYRAKVEGARTERRLGYLKHLLTTPTSLREILVNRAHRAITKDALGMADTLSSLEEKAAQTRAISGILGPAIPALSRAAVLGLALPGLKSGTVSVGDLSLIFIGFSSLVSATEAVLVSAGGIHEGKMYFAHLDAPWSSSEFVSSVPDPSISTLAPRSPDLPAPSLYVKGLTFRYHDEGPVVLAGLDFTIVGGTTVCVMGPNGSGKSTLLRVLAGLMKPTTGMVLVDGVDVASVHPERRWSNMVLLGQDPLRLEDTLRRNIDPSQTVPAGLESAAQMAGLASVLDRSPLGLDQSLSLLFSDKQSGGDLSGGQWQRVAFARFFAKSAQIGILDEPTAFLDAVAETDIIERLRAAVKDMTVVIATHDARLLSIADRIVVLDAGLIVEDGTHEELLALRGHYFSLVAPQLRPLLPRIG